MKGTLTANGVSEPMPWYGGSGMLIFWGTFGGQGSMSLESSPDNGTTWIHHDGWGTVDEEIRYFTVGFIRPPCLLRVRLGGVQTSASVSFKIARALRGEF